MSEAAGPGVGTTPAAAARTGSAVPSPETAATRPAAAQGLTARPLQLRINGQPFDATVSQAATLLQVLRNDAGCNGPKYGCGLGQCGACTVLVDGKVARACVVPAQGVAGRSITTVEGLGSRDAPHPVQQAFIDAQAAQCGYCSSGFVMATVALLRRCPQPSTEDINAALSHNLCRCGAHVEIVQAVQRAVQLMQRA